MTPFRRLALAALALVSLGLASSAALAQIRLGVAGPITGANAAFGAQLKNGTEQAVDDLNAKGGLLEQKVEVEVGDDVSDPKQGVSVANKFVGDGVTLRLTTVQLPLRVWLAAVSTPPL